MMRLYRALLRLYPASFREEYGNALCDVFARRAERTTGALRGLRLAAAAVADVVPNAAALHGEILARDVAYLLRLTRRRPLYFSGLVAVLALGVGANGAVFSIVRAVLLRPLPYRDPADLVMLWNAQRTTDPGLNAEQRAATQRRVLTPEQVVAWREQTRDVFTDVAAMRMWRGNSDAQFDAQLGDHAERLRGAFVTPNFFDVLGVSSHDGRLFTANDESTGAPLVVISHGLWARAFGSDPAIAGRAITLVGGYAPRAARTYTIAGVLPRAFHFTYPDETEVWVLESWADLRRYPAMAVAFWTVGRVRPDVSHAAAQARVATVTDGPNVPPFPGQSDWISRAEPMRDWVVGNARSSVWLLAAASALLLVITCVTVANALLVRVSATQRELTVRAALGAHPARLRRELLTHGAAIAVAGTVAGTVLSVLCGPLLRAFVPETFPRSDEIGADGAVLAFAALAATITTIAAAVAPAWRGARAPLETALRRASAGVSSDRTARRWRAALVAAQSTVATALLTTAALLVTSFWRLGQVPLGFDGERVLTAEMRAMGARYRSDDMVASLQVRLVDAIRAVPGVTAVGLTSAVPFRGTDYYGRIRRVDDTAHTLTHFRYVDSAFFTVMRIPVMRGRTFSRTDARGSAPVAMVSASLARSLFGSEDAIGKVIDGDEPKLIVGVVGDVRYQSFQQEPRPAVYVPRSQSPERLLCVVVRTLPGARSVASDIRTAIHQIDPALPAMHFATIGQILGESVSQRRFYTSATVAFALVALALTLTGIGVIVSRIVIERRREFAIRSALGASPSRLVGLMAAQGLAPVVVGAALGAAATFACARLLSAFLYGVPSRDPVTFIAAVATIVCAGAIAALIPAQRVTRTPPAAVLHSE